MKRLGDHPTALHAVLLLGLAVYAVGMTWPLAVNMSDHVIGAIYYWDAYTNNMAMGARVQNVLGNGPGGHYESYFFAPIPNSIVFNENLFGLSLLYAPFHLITRQPLLSYNLVLLLSLTLSAYFMTLLVRRLTGSLLAGILCGGAFAFCPYAFFEMGRIQLVATQWIPMTVLFLHRAIEGKKLRDMIGLGAGYALQVGTCLYYALFMLPVLALLGAWLLAKHRPLSRGFLLKLLAVSLGTGGVILAMVFPYFTSRKNFSLIRTPEFAMRYDGSLSFLFNVAPSNKLLTAMHHVGEPKGAHEEIAFPGFTIMLLGLIGLAVPLIHALRGLEARRRLVAGGRALLALAATAGASYGMMLLTHTMLAGLAVLVLAAVVLHLRGPGPVFPAPQSMYLWLLVLVVALFLGIQPFEYDDAPIKGLYHYLYTHVPGFNGIRKISRQAIMVMFALAVLAGFGGARLFGSLRKPRARGWLFVVVAALITLEFLSAPSKLIAVPAGNKVSEAYRWIAKQPGKRFVAMVPASDGKVFRGHRGMARHNYFTLHHRRRTLNGKSSFIPPVTWLYNHATRRLPSRTSTRILNILGAEFVVFHAWDMSRRRARRALRDLEKATLEYQLVFKTGDDHVYRMLPQDDPSLGLLETPALPAGVSAVPRNQIWGRASRNDAWTRNAFDGDTTTKWATRRAQRKGDWFEIRIDKPTNVAAIDFTDFKSVFDTPLGFKVETGGEAGVWKHVFSRPRLRIFTDQIYRPKDFLYRVVFPRPVTTTRLRFTILEAVPGHWWSIHETTVWAK